MEGVFVFDDIINVDNNIIKAILSELNTDELTRALIREEEKIRKLFYRNMPLDDLTSLDKKLRTTEAFTEYDKKLVQRKILKIISEIPEYTGTRFESGFTSTKEFEEYLLGRHQPESPYGMFEKDITMLKFFESKNGDKVLADIKLKNERENMGNIHIPNTNIQLINYSICPKCSHVFSYKDISNYYLSPKPDSVFRNRTQQYRKDTRVLCNECGTYFLPALVIVDGTPKSEVQFLCRIQTMDAIEAFYLKKGIKVLTKRRENIVALKKEAVVKTNRATVTGIKNDVLLKEMEEKPTLISNLIQYTPPNLIINLVEGNNVKNGDLLFGALQ
jgi:hypothetical protein